MENGKDPVDDKGLMQPGYTLDHVHAHRAEFEERWRVEAIERGLIAGREFIENERKEIERILQFLDRYQALCAGQAATNPAAGNSETEALDVMELIAPLHESLHQLQRYEDDLHRATDSFESARRERRAWAEPWLRFVAEPTSQQILQSMEVRDSDVSQVDCVN